MGDAFNSGGTRHLVYLYLNLFSSIFASLCSVAVIYLIRKMGLKNGHVLLIETMSWFQLLYDVTLFNSSVEVGNDSLYNFASATQLIGGIGSALTSNFIALIAFYVVKYIRSVDVYYYYPAILTTILIPSLVCVILYIMSCHNPYAYLQDVSELYMYYYIRIASILLNFIICFLTATRIHYTTVPLNSSTKSVMDQAISALSLRLIYYPVVQAVSRSSVAWYEAVYGFNFDPQNTTKPQFIGQCFLAILTPSASFGYLLIFLLMQPNAWECLKCTLMCRPYEPKKTLTANEVRAAINAEQNALNNQRTAAPYFDPNIISIQNPIARKAPDERPSGSMPSDTGSLISANFCMSDVDDGELWLLVSQEHDMTRRNSDDSNL